MQFARAPPCARPGTSAHPTIPCTLGRKPVRAEFFCPLDKEHERYATRRHGSNGLDADDCHQKG